MTEQRWQAEQEIAGRFLTELEVGASEEGWPQLRGCYEQRSQHGRVYGAFRLRIAYPPPFPLRNAQPRVWIENPPSTWVNTVDGHVYPDWELCLGVALDSEIDFTQPDSGIKLVEAVDTFLRLERIYQRDRRWKGDAADWPGPQRSHGLLGYYESIRAMGEPGRNDPCLCGSGLKYKACHWAQMETNKESLRRLYDAKLRERAALRKARSQ